MKFMLGFVSGVASVFAVGYYSGEIIDFIETVEEHIAKRHEGTGTGASVVDEAQAE